MNLSEGTIYQVCGGPRDKLLFCFSFGHKRVFLHPDDYSHNFPGVPFLPIDPDLESRLPTGPFMPTTRQGSLEELLLSCSDCDHIREKLCSSLVGAGYEIGAGERPSCVPSACEVTYIDKFTFEEASDGSFRNKTKNNLVSVSHYEEMEQLKSIPDDSAEFFIACHVIEHVPNVIRGFREIHKKLRRGGHFILVVPDKRYIFDADRPTTSLEHFIADDAASETPTLEHYLEYARRSKHDINWQATGLHDYQNKKDCHFHTFTPDSFQELLSYIKTMMFWDTAEVFSPHNASSLLEFYVRIRK